MPYLIDGHNLIPKIPGLALHDVDDEIQLVTVLQEFCRRQRKRVEVFFDNAPTSQPRVERYGAVIARFARQGQTADEVIRLRLVKLERNARNWTVVSSDQAVQAAARAARAHYISSETFATELTQVLENDLPDPAKTTDAQLSQDEVKEWLELFKRGRERD